MLDMYVDSYCIHCIFLCNNIKKMAIENCHFMKLLRIVCLELGHEIILDHGSATEEQ